ncbi:MAG TPA: hypothetical protein VGF61_02765 [Candidatus Acidoferrum sp.]|jgi:hypothetical protein
MAIDSCLVDTNILLRMTRQSDPQHEIVANSLAVLAGQATVLGSAYLRFLPVLSLQKISNLRVFNATNSFDPHRPYQHSLSLHGTCEKCEAAKGSINKEWRRL